MKAVGSYIYREAKPTLLQKRKARSRISADHSHGRHTPAPFAMPRPARRANVRVKLPFSLNTHSLGRCRQFSYLRWSSFTLTSKVDVNNYTTSSLSCTRTWTVEIYLQPARALILASRQQMLAWAMVPPRRPACICVSALDSNLRCRCRVVWRRRTSDVGSGRKQMKTKQ